MSILQSRVAWEFCVGQARPAEIELIRTNRVRREKVMCARGADDVVLIDTVAADADRADEYAVPIKSETARKNCDSSRQIQSDAIADRGRAKICGGRECHIRLRSGKSRKQILLGEERPGAVAINARRIIALRQKSDTPSRHRPV